MKLKQWLRDKIVFPCVNCFPYRFRNKLKMMGTCLCGEGWGYLEFPDWLGALESVTEEEIRDLYQELPDHSLNVLLDYLKYIRLGTTFSTCLDLTKHNVIIAPSAQLFPGLEEKIKREEQARSAMKKARSFEHYLPEVFYYHHGLKFLDEKVLRHIRGTVFLDLGAFVGDSTYVLSKYAPSKILAFEPSAQNREKFVRNMTAEGIGNYELIPAGVSDQPGAMCFDENQGSTTLGSSGANTIDLVTIDDFLKERATGKIGLIKADLEGMGLKMVRGAIEAIRRDRPVLLLSIYHNKEELLGIYRFLKENVQGYRYRVEALAKLCEITLIASPEEAGG